MSLSAALRCLTLAASLVFAGHSALAQTPFGGVAAVKEGLEIGTSTSEIGIASDFRGADLTIFGALTNADELLLAIGQYDVVVTLEGPLDYATVRKKSRVLGIWVNTESMTFEQVPASYSVAATRQIDDILTVDGGLPIGTDHMRLSPTGYIGNAGNLTEFRDAYRRLKLAGGLYQHDFGGVRFVSSSLFRASLRLPANVPDGVHMVRAYLFKSGTLLAERELPLRVNKTGIEQQINDAAHNQPILYGILCVLIALVTGWGASLMFRKK